MIGVKAAVAHRRAYEPIAARMWSVDTPGPYQRQVSFVAMTTTGAFNGTLTGWTVRHATFGANPNGGLADRVLSAAGPSSTSSWTNTINGSSTGIDSLSISVALQQP